MFREILQGLNHIHEQGMIHRDLKPGNVLIDAHGHAKIGDFGLATSKMIPHAPFDTKIIFNEESSLTVSQNSSSLVVNDPQFNDSASMSGAIGTPSYTAPEIMEPSYKNKFIYTQKVDIYSLGIMFFEMCFPFSTAMERFQVIQKLRQKEIIISSNINTQAFEKQISLIKLMLNHDPHVRPSTKEMLHNEMIPRKADEVALDELLKYSVTNKQSTNYKKILKSLFDQTNSKIDDAVFDATNCKSISSISSLQLRDYVHNKLVGTFQKHGIF